MPEARRRLSREDRQAQILDVATDLFGAHGYERTRMTQVAERVGVTKPVLYRHFASKEALFLACALRTWQAMGRAIFEAATRPGPPDVRLWRGISAYFDFIDEHRAVWRVVYPQASRGDTEVGRELREAQRASVQMMAGLFASTADEEHVDPALATLAEPLAWAFVGAATALAARWLENPDEPKELQSLRLMNFAWQGLGDLLRADVWLPPDGWDADDSHASPAS